MEKISLKSLVASVCIALAASACTPPVPQPPALAMTEKAVIPAYERLAKATAHQADVWHTGCSDKAALIEAYHEVADGWAGVFHWNVGPITLLLRRDRFYHWPQRRNIVSRSLHQLLAEQDPAKLEAETFAKTSVAVQGLPALERLLFGKTDPSANDWACQIGRAIADNLNAIAIDTAQDWRTIVVPALQAGNGHPLYFADMQELANRLFTDYLAAFTIIKDQKILAVMGPDLKSAQPLKAEARRSQRSLRTIEENMTALAIEGDQWARLGSKDNQKALKALFADARAELEGLSPLPEAIKDEAQRAQLTRFSKKLTEIQTFLRTVLAPEIGLDIGFNSLDGD